MTIWKNTPDDILLQAQRNHCIRVWNSVPDFPETKEQKEKVLHQCKEFYEKYPDMVEALEEEISKLIG
jgi:hypothetical protein